MDLVLGLEFLLAKHHSLQSNRVFPTGGMDRAQTHQSHQKPRAPASTDCAVFEKEGMLHKETGVQSCPVREESGKKEFG